MRNFDVQQGKMWLAAAAIGVMASSAFAATITTTSSKDDGSSKIRLRYGSFDTSKELSDLGRQGWSAHQNNELYIVQFDGSITSARLDAIKLAGGEPLRYLPDNAYVVRMNGNEAKTANSLKGVQWIGLFKSDYKVSVHLQNDHRKFSSTSRGYDLVLADRADRTPLIRKVERIGGKVTHRNEGSVLIEANLTAAQLRRVLELPEVLWAERTPLAEVDMDNARIQGGSNFLEKKGLATIGYTGIGINAHVMEGANPDHQDFGANAYRKKPIAIDDGAYQGHGQATFGIIFGDGTGDPTARGIIPNAQGFYTNYNAVISAEEGNEEKGSRYELVGRLKDHRIMLQTASWGFARVTEYTARSAEMDAMIFDHDIAITQSQSNSGSRQSRPQAWAKNIISVGAVYHHDNADPSDDSWDNYGASIGPATDGRIKPDVVAYYDDIHTTGQTEYTSFGGTSGATPIVAGHVGLILEMYTDGLFGNTLLKPNGDRFDNRPHFTTTKAILINSAAQYDFDGADHMLTRVHQGWGFPNLKGLFEQREKMLLVNEDQVLKPQEKATYNINVAIDTPELRATLVFADPEGNVVADFDRINDLDLKVTAPDGTIYWGNNGLLEGNYSKAGGVANTVDTVENVIIEKPAAGEWKVEIIASEINADSHIETSELDADFALVVSGIKK